MHKAIVETRGSYFLMGSLHSGEDRVPFERPAVVLRTYYIDSRVQAGAGYLRVLADELPPEANDTDWLEVLESTRAEDGSFDVEAALAAYLSELKVEAETDEDREARETAEAEEAERLAKEKNKPNDTTNVAPKMDNKQARAAKDTHQSPAEG